MNYPAELRGVLATCEKILFSKNNFMIAVFNSKDDNNRFSFSAKGAMSIKEGQEYKVDADLDTSNPKYPNTYKILSVRKDIDLKKCNKTELISFIGDFVGQATARTFVNAFDDPIAVLEKADMDEVTSIKGIGESKGEKLIDGYLAQKNLAPLFVFFARYNLGNKVAVKALRYFKSIGTTIQKVEEDPYNLTYVPGIGFKKADAAFLYYCSQTGQNIHDKRRTQAYVRFLFEEEFSKGNTWLKPKDFLDKVLEFLPGVNIQEAVACINESPQYMAIDMEKSSTGYAGKRLTSKRNVLIEMEIAKLLKDKLEEPSVLEIGDYEADVKKIEERQGWAYSDEQREALNNMIQNNLYLVQGAAGTGKSSVVAAFVEIIKSRHYSFAQCALSGKAANNLALVTQEKGSTIHSLVGVGRNDQYQPNRPMPFDVVILDELSMVDANIFLTLLRAMKQGSKLIMLGDSGQLDSIGVGVMNGILESQKIPSITLNQIHRQAQDSAIITHSLSFRKGLVNSELKMASETVKIYGKKQDMEYIFVKSSKEESIYKCTMKRFSDCIGKYGVDGVQIICSTKSTGKVSVDLLNQGAQLIANPFDINKEEYEVSFGSDDKNAYFLRVGDKVINTKNNRKTLSPKGKERPIFNGNTGTLKSVEQKGGDKYFLIDFDGIGEVLVSEEDVKYIRLGYAITVHKSQGSTIPCVILAMPYHFLLNSRELLYTGVTRASDYQITITSPKTLKAALQKTSKRIEQTNLNLFLQELELWQEILDIDLERELNKKYGIKSTVL